MRGKADSFLFLVPSTRITPACAGKSGGGIVQHPDKQGSPPRVRGKALFQQGVGVLSRITPACAGKSRQRVPNVGKREDHPRVCGEKAKRVTIPSGILGSPPRVRGKAEEHADNVDFQRITPACAGKRNFV